MMPTLMNPSREGDVISPGEMPVIWPGVLGVWFDEPEGIYVASVYAIKQGNGDVGRMIDAMPKDRRIVFTTVISERLEGMLFRRGYQQLTEYYEDEPYSVMVRSAEMVRSVELLTESKATSP
jgi:hypothetical protein